MIDFFNLPLDQLACLIGQVLPDVFDHGGQRATAEIGDHLIDHVEHSLGTRQAARGVFRGIDRRLLHPDDLSIGTRPRSIANAPAPGLALKSLLSKGATARQQEQAQ